MKNLFSILLLAVTISTSFAEESTQTPVKSTKDKGIGVAAGCVSGFGLSYRKWWNNNGIQFTFAPIYNERKEDNYKYVNASLGIIGLRRLHENKFADLFLFYGAHVWNYYNSQPENYNYYDLSNNTMKAEKHFMIQTGIGPGIDFHLGRISLNIMTGLRGGYDDITGDKFMRITGETAMYYTF